MIFVVIGFCLVAIGATVFILVSMNIEMSKTDIEMGKLNTEMSKTLKISEECNASLKKMNEDLRRNQW